MSHQPALLDMCDDLPIIQRYMGSGIVKFNNDSLILQFFPDEEPNHRSGGMMCCLVLNAFLIFDTA